MGKFKLIGRKRKYIREENPVKMMEYMANRYLDVLQNIEVTIIHICRQKSEIDDEIVASALKSAINGGESDNETLQFMVKALENARMLRLDISDEIWKKGLKVVLHSVYNHSRAQKGDTDYIEFVSEFVP